jgi:hypothetical protein
MQAPVELVPLRCLRCDTPVPAEPDEVAWICEQCGQGLLLDEAQGLAALDIHFAAGIPPAAKGRPFWVTMGQVQLVRESREGFIGSKTGQAERFWAEPRRFFIPAFTCPLEDLLEMGSSLVQRPLDLQPGPPVRFLPVTSSPEDVPALAEFIVLAVEAERKDNLRRIETQMSLGSPVLWVLP